MGCMIMKEKKFLLIKCIAIPLLVGGVAGFITRGGMETFQQMNQPPLSPPPWLFPIVWTILYTLMGIASYLILTSDAEQREKDDALALYYDQLVVNFLWPVFFFSFQWYLFSFFWILLLWLLVFWMIWKFSRISKTAAKINIPYLLWLTFAAYLNFGVWWLNR